MLSREIPRLKSAHDVPLFLRSFFASGRSDRDRAVHATDGLWTLLSWCWERSPDERRASALCQTLIVDRKFGWRNEDDVLEAMARGLTAHDPSRLSHHDVDAVVRAFLAEGEDVRGQNAHLDLRLEFVLPPIVAHPLYDADHIIAALEKHGTPGVRVREHLDAVHPERRPYRGAWRIAIRDRLESDDPSDSGCGDTIPIANDRLASRSRVSLTLEYEADFAGYFRLSVQGARTGLFGASTDAGPHA